MRRKQPAHSCTCTRTGLLLNQRPINVKLWLEAPVRWGPDLLNIPMFPSSPRLRNHLDGLGRRATLLNGSSRSSSRAIAVLPESSPHVRSLLATPVRDNP